MRVNGKVFEVCEGLNQFIGLMFQKPRPLIFPMNGKKTDIHMFFVFHEIEVFWVRDEKVVKKELARPFRIYPGVKADYLLEAPVGYLKVREGEKIKIS